MYRKENTMTETPDLSLREEIILNQIGISWTTKRKPTAVWRSAVDHLVLAGLVERRRDDEWLNEWRLTAEGFETVKVIDRFGVVAYADSRMS
jgi:hypothetical protein